MVLSRSRLVNVLLALAMIFAAAVGGALVSRVDLAGAGPSSGIRPVVEPINPCRILETRGPGSGGPTGTSGLVAPVGPGVTLTLQVSGAVGQGGCIVAGGLAGAVLNITAVDATADTFLKVYPCDGPVPATSTLNPFPNRITFNSAVVDLSATGTICIFNNTGSVNVIADATGIVYDHNHDDRYLTAATYSIVTSVRTVPSFAAGAFELVSAACPVDTRVVGGGSNNNANGLNQNIVVSSDYPSQFGGGVASNRFWRVAYRNVGVGAIANVELRAFAICMGGSAVTNIPATVLDGPAPDGQ